MGTVQYGLYGILGNLNAGQSFQYFLILIQNLIGNTKYIVTFHIAVPDFTVMATRSDTLYQTVGIQYNSIFAHHANICEHLLSVVHRDALD